MTMKLPAAIYHTTLPRASSTSVANPRNPGHVFEWPDFEPAVLQWVRDNAHQDNARRLRRPTFVPMIITREVPELQVFIKFNLLDVAAACCTSFDFVSWGIIDRTDPNARAEPDYAARKNEILAAPVEIKGKWTLPGQSIVDSENAHVQSAITQAYTQMRHNHRRFGIITSYEFTWFLRRDQCPGGENCENGAAGHEILLISPGIALNQGDQTHPYILQCFAYFSWLCSPVHMDSPPPSSRTSPRSSRSQPQNRGSPSSDNFSASGSSPRVHGMSRGQSSGSMEVSDCMVEQDFDVDDFYFDSILGFGRTKVCYDAALGLAVKFADMWKNPELLAELRNEVAMYRELSVLQGRFIPKVELFGHWAGLYCIGFSLIGRAPVYLDQQQKDILIRGLHEIHELGIVHNDIKKDNILVDDSGRPYLIDFGFASKTFDILLQNKEKLELLKCLETFQ
ncbi:hypothetical protein BDR26DRAFT_848591 [Obelidium mucronatum]|nr:hypothetical protein BDR26DRAFT_848591 [Obelidium mucronatum]